MLLSGVQRQKQGTKWCSTPEKDPKLALNAQNSSMHVISLSLSPSTHQVGPRSGFLHHPS
ncbi:uncharacterized protein DS421_12g366190 [Arachis hypogaea]|nr:uncharacterized protein DS421_12g366190 [Arachis hypogaea]